MCPAMLNWQAAADNDSMYNTPPTFALYLAGLVFDWLAELGGLTAMEAINRRKAEKLYAAIDGSDFYANPVELASRSLMNVPFTLADAAWTSCSCRSRKRRACSTSRGIARWAVCAPASTMR